MHGHRTLRDAAAVAVAGLSAREGSLPRAAAVWRMLCPESATCAVSHARRDIKLENTLLDGAQPLPNVKICDFGYSKNEFVDSRPKTVSGTPDYIAPEVRAGCVADPGRRPIAGPFACSCTTTGSCVPESRHVPFVLLLCLVLVAV